MSTPAQEPTPPERQQGIRKQIASGSKFDAISAERLNDLAHDIRENLSRGLFGNHYIEGSRQGDDTRLECLKLVRKLLAELDVTNTELKKYTAMQEVENGCEAKKPGKANNNTLATIRNVVEEQLSGEFRNLKIRCERTEAKLAESEKRNAQLESKQLQDSQRIKALEKKQPDGTQKPAVAVSKPQKSATRIQAVAGIQAPSLEHRVASCEEKLTHLVEYVATRELANNNTWDFASGQAHVNHATTHHDPADETHGFVEGVVADGTIDDIYYRLQSADDASEDVLNFADDMQTRACHIEKQVTRITSRIEEHSARLEAAVEFDGELLEKLDMIDARLVRLEHGNGRKLWGFV